MCDTRLRLVCGPLVHMVGNSCLLEVIKTSHVVRYAMLLKRSRRKCRIRKTAAILRHFGVATSRLHSPMPTSTNTGHFVVASRGQLCNLSQFANVNAPLPCPDPAFHLTELVAASFLVLLSLMSIVCCT